MKFNFIPYIVHLNLFDCGDNGNMAATKCLGSALLMVFVVLIFYFCNFNSIDVPAKVFVHSLWTNESATSLYDAKMNHKVVVQFGGLYKVTLPKCGYCKSRVSHFKWSKPMDKLCF
jgi:hypothetical protein